MQARRSSCMYALVVILLFHSTTFVMISRILDRHSDCNCSAGILFTLAFAIGLVLLFGTADCRAKAYCRRRVSHLRNLMIVLSEAVLYV